MSLTKYLKPKRLFRYFWFIFGLIGLIITLQKYAPDFLKNFQNSSALQRIQAAIIKSVNQQASGSIDTASSTEAVSQVITSEITKVIDEQKQNIKQFPQKQIRKIKIGACEELLEEDICAVASELNCGQSSED